MMSTSFKKERDSNILSEENLKETLLDLKKTSSINALQ